MGNTPSHPATPNAGTPSNPAAGTSNQTTGTATSSGPTPAQPIATSSTPTITPSTIGAFHSGLTPPPAPPSPPPPSTPPLLPYGGHLSAQNPHALSLPQAHDYSKSTVTRLILEAKLAPFYRGLEDYEEDWTEEHIGQLLDEIREKDYEEGVGNSVVEAMKSEREGGSGVGSVVKKIGIHRNRDNRREEEKEERDKREKRAYLGAVECPICFLSYPPNINTSRCCQQPICTECFVQIKRTEATITHLESEPACCPFCVETDFGVIYERPNIISPLSSQSALASQSALSISPDASTSGLSRALDLSSEDAELSIGVGMAPKAQETVRRKSVSHKSKEVVTIDEIRPDWENKLNAVKAAAARKASRRIVMRQVGDRLIPIGFTSSRAPGTADFSMSVGGDASGNASGSGSPARRGLDGRRGSGRERQLAEEWMIMEAMRLSLIDHEEHQRRQISGEDNEPPPSASAQPERGPERRKFSLSVPQSSNATSSRRASDGMGSFQPKHEKTGSKASQFFSKISGSGNRSRSGSTASSLNRVTFSPSTTNLNSSRPGTAGLPPPSPRPTTPSPPIATASTNVNPILTTSTASTATPSNANLGRSPPSSLNPTSSAPVAPVTTLAHHTSVKNPSPNPIAISALGNPPAPEPVRVPTPVDLVSRDGPGGADTPPGLPRISLDMPTLIPDHPAARNSTAANSNSKTGQESVATHYEQRGRLNRTDTGFSEASEAGTVVPTYAQLDSDEE